MKQAPRHGYDSLVVFIPPAQSTRCSTRGVPKQSEGEEVMKSTPSELWSAAYSSDGLSDTQQAYKATCLVYLSRFVSRLWIMIKFGDVSLGPILDGTIARLFWSFWIVAEIHSRAPRKPQSCWRGQQIVRLKRIGRTQRVGRAQFEGAGRGKQSGSEPSTWTMAGWFGSK